MLWKEEQRGLGERMITNAENEAGCCGYATFAEEYDEQFRRWLDGLSSGFLVRGVEASPRLADLRGALARLVRQLDDEDRYPADTWLARTNAGSGDARSSPVRNVLPAE
jgi:hypothetical protein